jgi:hypothetical protein
MMHPLYLLKPSIEHPTPPEHWSYSTLKSWRECPKRWWLERCRYPNIAAKFYPAPVSAAALEGQLVHQVVEEWGKAGRRGEEQGSVRLRLKIAIRATLTALKDNPRVNVGRLDAAISIDACVAKAHDLIGDLEPATQSQGSTRSTSGGASQAIPSGAEEFWLVVEDPPLKGQLDRVRDRVVTDFKTGAHDSAHTDQLHFYAVLWWLKYGELPERLELRYPRVVVQVPVPTRVELSALIASIGAEIESARAELQAGNPSARPSAEGCRYCPVRQLCDEYWKSPETFEHRLLGTSTTQQGPQTRFGDVQLIQLPRDPRRDGVIVGEAVAAGLGPVRVRIGAHLSPPPSASLVEAKILGSKMTTEGHEKVITTTPGTEVFWQE